MEWRREEAHDNVIAGAVGAFLGSLIGVACIILVSRLGYVASVSGVVMAVCAIKGYSLLGGRYSKRGAVISCILIIVMTYIANKIDFALTITEALSAETDQIDFFMVYSRMGFFLEDDKISRLYWGSLAMLYLFTLIGGVPVLIGSLRDPAVRQFDPSEPDVEDEQPPIQGEFYAQRKDWVRPLRSSVFLPMMIIVLAFLCGIFITHYFREVRLMYAVIYGGFVSVVYSFVVLFKFRPCSAFHILYVRVGDKLWQVDLQRFCRVENWEKQSEIEKDAIKHDVLREINRMQTADISGYPSGALTELKDLRIEKENAWIWTCSYESQDGRRKKIRIGKVYPDFCPVLGAERTQRPFPTRWTPTLIVVVLTFAMIGVLWAVDLSSVYGA